MRTLDEQLVLCGARSSNTIDWVNGQVSNGAVPERMDCGLDRIVISEEAALELSQIWGKFQSGCLDYDTLILSRVKKTGTRDSNGKLTKESIYMTQLTSTESVFLTSKV